jgi:hypothetical protein
MNWRIGCRPNANSQRISLVAQFFTRTRFWYYVQRARVILFSGATLRALGRYGRSAGIERWVREDLNLHILSGTCTSSMRVCQFRHDRKFQTRCNN